MGAPNLFSQQQNRINKGAKPVFAGKQKKSGQGRTWEQRDGIVDSNPRDQGRSRGARGRSRGRGARGGRGGSTRGGRGGSRGRGGRGRGSSSKRGFKK